MNRSQADAMAADLAQCEIELQRRQTAVKEIQDHVERLRALATSIEWYRRDRRRIVLTQWRVRRALRTVRAELASARKLPRIPRLTQAELIVAEDQLAALQILRSMRSAYVPKDHCGIYFLFKSDNLVYIGQAVDVHSRVRAHWNEARISFSDVAFLPVAQSRLNAVEEALIRFFRPHHNRTFNGTSGTAVAWQDWRVALADDETASQELDHGTC